MAIGDVLAEKEGALGWLIFNRPERHNAISTDMWRAIRDMLADFNADPGVRVIILRGAGERAFVSGADISQYERNNATPEDSARTAEIVNRGRNAIRDSTKPTIAMIHGYCLGGGLSVALLCDLRIASEDARFGVPAAKLGIAYAYGSAKMICDRIGVANAKEMLLTARHFDAREALQMGLVNRIVPAADLQSTVKSYAEDIGRNAPLALAAAKIVLNTAASEATERDFTALQAAVDKCAASEDVKEGHRAFVEKRKPVFRGL